MRIREGGVWKIRKKDYEGITKGYRRNTEGKIMRVEKMWGVFGGGAAKKSAEKSQNS